MLELKRVLPFFYGPCLEECRLLDSKVCVLGSWVLGNKVFRTYGLDNNFEILNLEVFTFEIKFAKGFKSCPIQFLDKRLDSRIKILKILSS